MSRFNLLNFRDPSLLAGPAFFCRKSSLFGLLGLVFFVPPLILIRNPMTVRLLTLLSLLLLLRCELPMAEMRALPEPPTLEVPVVVKAAVNKDWVNLQPTSGLNIYVDAATEFMILSGLEGSRNIKVSGGDGISVVQTAPRVYEVSSALVGLGYIQLDYDSIETIHYPVMVRPIPDPIAVLSGWGNRGTIKRENVEHSLYVSLRPVDGLEKNHCRVFGYTVEKIPQTGLRETSSFYGNGKQDSLYHKVKAFEAGDLLIFDGIRARCKGDTRVRLLNPMVFTIK